MRRDVHDQIATSEPDYQKTVSFITRNYYWLELIKIIQHYNWNCHLCRHAKDIKDQYNGLLKPLSIFSRL